MGRWGCKSDFSDDNVPTLFYTDILGFKATVTGAILLFVTYTDVFINLILGVSANRTNTYEKNIVHGCCGLLLMYNNLLGMIKSIFT